MNSDGMMADDNFDVGGMMNAVLATRSRRPIYGSDIDGESN